MRGGETVTDSQCNSTFDQMYEQTYKKTLHYVAARCGGACDIADIMQEVYAELYSVLLSRGTSYIKQPEAFVMQLAKSKVYRHYSMREKIRNFFPVAQVVKTNEDCGADEFFISLENGDIDDLIADRILLQNIAAFIKTKPSDVQKIFYLYFAMELTTAQIAHEMRLNESTVKSKIHRTVHEVRALYGKVGTEK
jgi:RNA polymerase sigma-70 factor, ECF subfamily